MRFFRKPFYAILYTDENMRRIPRTVPYVIAARGSKSKERKYMDNQFKTDVLNAAKKIGIDLVGFASKARFENVDPQHNPFSIFPEAKTVIMVGKRICRGTLRGIEEGTNFTDYHMYGRNWLEDEFLAVAVYDLVRMIEDNGWEACPISTQARRFRL